MDISVLSTISLQAQKSSGAVPKNSTSVSQPYQPFVTQTEQGQGSSVTTNVRLTFSCLLDLQGGPGRIMACDTKKEAGLELVGRKESGLGY